MATLETRLRDLATAIGTGVKSVRTLINGNVSDLSALATTTKTNLVAALNEVRALALGKQDALGFTPLDAATKGVAGGVASLDGSGKVPAGQLPSFVDDVLEYASAAAFPGTGISGIIYIAIDSGAQYRWGGSSYVQMTASPGTTDAVPEGAANKYFTDPRAVAALAPSLGTVDTDYAAVFTTALS
jgi:hypothetical protein